MTALAYAVFIINGMTCASAAAWVSATAKPGMDAQSSAVLSIACFGVGGACLGIARIFA